MIEINDLAHHVVHTYMEPMQFHLCNICTQYIDVSLLNTSGNHQKNKHSYISLLICFKLSQIQIYLDFFPPFKDKSSEALNVRQEPSTKHLANLWSLATIF